MVLMEIINLDDTGDINEGEINACTSSTPVEINACTSSTPVETNACTSSASVEDLNKSTPKMTKKKKIGTMKKKIRLLQKLINRRSISSEAIDSDTTLNGSQCSNTSQSKSLKKKLPKKRNNKNANNKSPISFRKKRKLNTNDIVIIDSDDDCVEISKNSSKENKNTDVDVLCLSDASVIELSDTEDVGIVAGTVETVASNDDWKNQKEFSNILNSQKSKSSSIKNVNILKRKLHILMRQQNKQHIPNDIQGTSTSNQEQSTQHISKNDDSPVPSHSQSISYIPLDSKIPKTGPRPIVIDGSNVAFGHGKDKFSAKGIEICINFFQRRKHKEIRVFVPQFRRRHPATTNFEIMDKLEKEGYLVYTPSRQVGNHRITSYDDRYVVEYAAKTGGIIVTRDNYKDLLMENQDWRDTISRRILPYTFVGDMIMFPRDPLGRDGPPLDRFLMY